MKKQSGVCRSCAFIFAMLLLLSVSSPASAAAPARANAPTKAPAPAAVKAPATAASAVPTAGGSKDTCLGCHGPFDKLTAATAGYAMPSGEKTSPHRYVPHKSKNIPECSDCHKPHPVPLVSKAGLPKAETDYCYTCHHQGGLECGTCHP